jgi:YVTN family beta-propeller protein
VNSIAKKVGVGAIAVLVALLAEAPGALASPSAAPAGGEVSLAPAHPDPASPTYFTLRMAPGKSVHDAVVITNHSTKAVSLAVSAVDGLTGQTSGSVYANRQDPVRKAGRWVTPELSALTLAAQTSRTIGFTISVPAGVAPGDHLAGIAVENTVPTQSSNGFNIKQILRNVIGVRVIVPGAASFTPTLSSLGIQQIGATGIGSVTVGLGNAGRQLAKPTLAVAVAGPANYSKSLTRELDTVLPGDTIIYPFAWPDILPKGSYTVTSTIPVGATPRGVALSPDGSKVYVANQGSNNLSVISTATDTVTGTVDGWQRAPLRRPHPGRNQGLRDELDRRNRERLQHHDQRGLQDRHRRHQPLGHHCHPGRHEGLRHQ